MSINVENFKIGSSLVLYKDSELGATHGGIKVTVNTKTVDITCDQTFGQPVKRIVTAVNLTISMTLIEIDPSFGLLFTDGQIADSLIGSDLLQNGGELMLTPLDTSIDNVAYSFPNAILEPDCDYSISASGVHTLQVKFTAYADSDGIFVQKNTVA